MATNFVDVALQKVKKVALDLGKEVGGVFARGVQSFSNIGYSKYNPGIAATKFLAPQRTANIPLNQPTFGDVGNVTKAGLTGLGAITNPAFGLVGGAFGAGMNTIGNLIGKKPLLQNVGTAAGQGFVGGSMAAPVVGATNPLLLKALGKIPGAGFLASRVAPAGANVIQGLGINAATGTMPTPGGVGLDIAMGLAGGRGQFASMKLDKGANFENADAKSIGRLLQEVQKSGKLSIDGTHETLQLANKLLKIPKDALKTMSPEDVLGELNSLLTKNQRYAYSELPGMALTDTQPKGVGGVPEGGVSINNLKDVDGKPIGDLFGTNRPTIDAMVKAYKDPASAIWDRPIAVRKDGTIIEGLHRANAAKIAGVEPPIVVLTEKQVGGLNSTQVDELAKKLYKAPPTQPKGVGGVPEGGVGVNAPSQSLKSPTAEAVQTGRTPIPEVAPATKPQLQPELPVPKPPVVGGGQAGVPSAPIIDPVQKITEALKSAKPLEAKQAGIYSKIRAKQAGAIAGVGKNIPGEAGFHAQLGQLKGEMPKVEFESIRKQITQPDIDSLFNTVEQANITPFEKITAKSGLAKLLGAEGGTVPVQSELKLLSEVFPPEFIQSVLERRSVMQKLFSFGTEALNLPRAMMATADLSAPLRQGVFLIGRPKQWGPAFRDQFKYFFNEKAYKGLAEEIKARPTYQAMRQNKLAITDMSPLLQSREEAFMSNLAEKIPGFGKLARASNRAYSGFLNKLRADTFDDMYKSAKTLGLDMDTVGPDIAKFINAATGRGQLGALERAAPVLNGAFFSPRLMASRLNLLNPAFYVKLDPFVRKEAIKSLLTFAGTGATVLTLAKLAGADVGTDPTSSDFGKIKIGNTRLDIWGGFQQYFRAAGQLITGKYTSSTTGKEYTLGEGYKPLTRLGIVGRVIESKESPVLSFISTLLTGQNGLGGKLDVPVEILDRFTPMMLSGFYDLYKEGGLKEMGLGLPSIFGVGVQTYGSQIPTQETTPAGKPTIKLKPVPGLSEDIINKVRGTPVSNIPQEKWAGMVKAKTDDQQLKILKDKVKQNPQSTDKQILNQNNIYVTGEGDFVDLNPVISMPTTSSYEELQRQKKAYSLTDNILKLPVEEQAKAFSSIGISPDDATYYQVAKGATDLKTAYINDGIGGLDTKNRGDLINYLVSQRREVNGDMVLTNTIVTDLLNRDIISQTEATMLKNLKIVNGKPVTKLTGRGKKTALKKVSAPGAPTKIKAPNMKTLLAKTVKLKTKRYKFKRSFA